MNMARFLVDRFKHDFIIISCRMMATIYGFPCYFTFFHVSLEVIWQSLTILVHCFLIALSYMKYEAWSHIQQLGWRGASITHIRWMTLSIRWCYRDFSESLVYPFLWIGQIILLYIGKYCWNSRLLPWIVLLASHLK